MILKVIGKSKTVSEGDIQLVKKLYKCEQRDRKKDQTEAKLDHWSGALPQVSKLAATKPQISSRPHGLELSPLKPVVEV